MPLISRARLQELESKAALYDENKKEDRKAARNYERQLTRVTRELGEKFEDREDELNTAHRAEVKKLTAKIEEVQDKATAEVKKALKEADRIVEQAEKARKTAESQISTLKEAVEANGDLTKREMEVEAREAKIEIREEMIEHAAIILGEEQRELNGKVAAHAQEVANARKEGESIGEKRGYANGLADGVRKIGEQTEKAHERAASMGDKALDAVVEAAKKTPDAPKINVLSVPTASPANINNSNHQ